MGTHYKGTESEIRTLDAFIKLTRAADALNNRLNRHLADANITVSQFGTLEALYHIGPLNQRAIGEKILKSSGNTTVVIDSREQSGYVRREKDPADKQAVLIELTSQGEEYIKDFFPKHLEKIKEEFAILTEDEKVTLATLCRKLGLQER